MEHKEYLDELVKELMMDSDWELPPECRFFLVSDLGWSLLYL